MPGQIKIGSYNTKLLEWQKHHLFCFLLLPHRLPHNLEARNNDSILFKFCHHGEGLAEWIVLEWESLRLGSISRLFGFLVHMSPLLWPPQPPQPPPWGSSSSSLVLLVQSHLYMPAGFQQTGEKLLDHSLPCLGLEMLHCVRCCWSRLSEGPPASRRKFQKWALN